MVTPRRRERCGKAVTRHAGRGILPVMPRQRWRNEVLQELRNLSDEMRNHGGLLERAVERQDKTIHWLGEQNRAAVRDLKASVDRNTDITDRCAERLSGLEAQSRATDSTLVDLTDQIRAQTSALLTLVDEIRGRDDASGPAA